MKLSLEMFDIKAILQSKNFKNGMLYTVFSFLNNGISFVLLLILAKYLMPSDYGKLNLFSTFVTLLNIIITLSTTSYVAVSFFNKTREDLCRIINIALTCTTSMVGLLSICMLLYPSFMENIVGVNIKFLWLGVLISYFTVFNNLNLDIWRIEEKPIIYGFYSLSFAILNFILSFWIIVGDKMGWEGRIYAWFILASLYFIISVSFLIHRKYLRLITLPVPMFKETLLFSLPLIPHAASFWLKQGADRYILNFFYDTATVGYFSFAMNLSAVISILGTAFNATNSVYAFKTLSSEGYSGRKKLQRQALPITLGFGAITFAIVALANLLIIFFVPKYSASIPFLIPLGLGAFFQCIYFIWVNYLVFYHHTFKLMCITASTAVMQIALSIWLTRYSPEFTSWVSCTASGVTILLIFITAKKIIREQNLIELC